MKIKQTTKTAPPWREEREIQCVVKDCGKVEKVKGMVVPPGWKEIEDGLICPRHTLVVVVKEPTPEEALEEALGMVERGEAPS